MKVQDLFTQWQGSNNWAHVENSKECCKCRNIYITGDIVLVFDPTAADVKRGQFYCTACGFKRLAQNNEWPAGISIFIQQEHKGSEMELLPGNLQQRIVESCGIVDQLFKNIAAAYGEGKSVDTSKAKKQIEEAEAAGEDIPPAWRLN